MSSDQEAKATSPIPMEPEEIPGFEFELEENISQISTVESMNSMPRFEDRRHPNVKMFVMIFAIFGCFVIIFQSCCNIPREFRSILFSDADRDPKLIEYIEFVCKVTMEFFIPWSIIWSFLITHLTISFVPGMAFKMSNPVRILAKIINLTFFFHSFVNFFYSITLLQSISSTNSWPLWKEYLIVTTFGLFWMYQILNMSIFSRLTLFNFIRARENYEIRQMGLDA